MMTSFSAAAPAEENGSGQGATRKDEFESVVAADHRETY